MSDNKKKKVVKNVFETVKDIGSDAASAVKDQVKEMPFDAVEQIFGARPPKFSGEIKKGESISVKEVMSGKHEKNKNREKQIMIERRMLEEERIMIQQRNQELKIQLKMIQDEILLMSAKTGKLAKETKIAAMQVTVEPGVYHKFFFDWLLKEVKKMKQQIEKASIWLHVSNSRAQKKNAWGSNYKKHGAKYLLSSEHYLARSAG